MENRIMELIAAKRYKEFRREVMDVNEADVAFLIEQLPREGLLKVFRILPKDKAADVFAYFSIEVQQDLIISLSDQEATNIVDNLFADDAADLMEEMPASVVKRILANASNETRTAVNQLLQYPEYSAGSLMTVEFVDLKEHLTVEQAITRIRRVGVDKETINICYVLDKHRKLLGTVALRYLLLSDAHEAIGNIMNENVITISTKMDQEEVAYMFQKYDFTSMPVVDSEGRLVGIITVDDVVDIMRQEATEDIEKMAAIVPTDKPYHKTGVFGTWKKRVPWLLLLMISATFTGKIIQYYEDALGSYVILTAFIPMLMDTGGNAGAQSSVTIIRGLSLNEIHLRDIFKIVWKEFRVSILVGITLSLVNFLRLLLVDRVNIEIAIVVCVTLMATVVIAKFVGCTLPLLADRLGFDPAVMASPFITTIVDALSLIIYFRIATIMLHLA